MIVALATGPPLVCLWRGFSRYFFCMNALVHPDRSVEAGPSARQHSWWQGCILLLLIAWLYAPILSRLVTQWWIDPNFSHGFFVPLFCCYFLWRDRDRLRQLQPKPSSWGLLFVASAMALLIVGVLGAEIFLARLSLLALGFGLVVWFGGWRYCRAVLFPLSFLLLMIPPPAILMNQVTLPLQIFASKAAAATLPWLGVPVLREGNIINLPAMPLEVAEACSGLRSLLSLVTLAVIYGVLMEKTRAVRVLLVIAAVPIAICANSLRIIGTGLLVQYWSPDKAEGFFHAFAGWLMFVASLSMLYLSHRVLSWWRQGIGVQRVL